ncbi:unnamed protein product [Chrysoparadoxa australica]
MPVAGYAINNDAPRHIYKPEDSKSSALSYPSQISEKLDIKVMELSEEAMVFQLVGVDVSFANALRRIMLAEVPTMAIECVYMFMNTSIIQDEVLAHRLGLVPIKADPRMFEVLEQDPRRFSHEHNTLVFKLEVKCEQPPKEEMEVGTGTTTGLDSDEPYTLCVYSRDLQWVPQGKQEEKFPEGIAPVHDDILLAKLRPGQEIIMEVHCRKSIGKDHMKYSPVSTAAYRLLPEITLPEAIEYEDAKILKEKCPMDVFDVEDIAGVPTAKVARSRSCSMCRECIREKPWDERVKLSRKADHFIFSVESVGMLKPQEVVEEALGVLRKKCAFINREVEEWEVPLRNLKLYDLTQLAMP